jgi:hypothetical protein
VRWSRGDNWDAIGSREVEERSRELEAGYRGEAPVRSYFMGTCEVAPVVGR